jgi:hypothetical protein
MRSKRKPLRRMILEPTIHNCIETIARRRYWSLVEEYSKTDEINEAMENDIELLKRFLEETDIAALRGETEKRLSKNESPRVTIKLDTEGRLIVKVR